MARKTFANPPRMAAPAMSSMVAEDRSALWGQKTLKSRLLFAIGPTLMVALGATVVASAQSNSPFANERKVNAWELPQAGTAPLEEVQPQAPAATAPQSGGIRLRSRTLSPETAATPPSGTPSVAAPQPIATSALPDLENAPQPMAAPENYAYSETTAGSAAPVGRELSPEELQRLIQSSNSPSRYSSAYDSSAQTSAAANAQTGSSFPPRGSYNSSRSNPAPGSYGASGPSGSYGSVPRGSVNSPPTRSVNDDTDWTVHQVPSQMRPYPGQQQNAQAGVGQYEGNRASSANQYEMGQYEAQSQNPTAYDYGYRRADEPAAEGMAAESQYGSYGSPDPRNGPYADPYAQTDGQSGPNGYGGPGPAPKRGFFDRIGLSSISTLLRGAIRGGVAARENNGWEEAFVGDADIELEISTVTQGGLEWGIHGQVRAQYDEGRKGFMRRLPDCPPTTAGCPTILVGGNEASVRGHTSQFYTFGPDTAQDTQAALESAHLFLRSAYGDVTIGRDDGAAYLFSLGAPTLLNVGASNSPVDYTGLDAVKTLNDASGFAEKVTYTSPRLLGDQVGVGVQFGVSYAMDADACGVDYCVNLNEVPNVVAPDIQDIMEAGVAFDRTFAPGISVEATATYARGSENSGLTGLDDLQAYGAGMEISVHDFTLGGSYLNSNQGLMAGDYEAYDVGLTWQPSVLGFTVGYGHANDANVGLSSDQFTGGVTYDINDRIRLGAGVQYSDRDTRQDVAGTAQTVNDKATAIFIEAGITF